MAELDEKLGSLWQKFRPVNQQRVALLEAAAREAIAGELQESTRREAEGAAHKIAGAAGTFGFLDVTELARTLELQLTDAAVAEPRVFAARVEKLKELVEKDRC